MRLPLEVLNNSELTDEMLLSTEMSHFIINYKSLSDANWSTDMLPFTLNFNMIIIVKFPALTRILMILCKTVVKNKDTNSVMKTTRNKIISPVSFYPVIISKPQ